MKNRFLSTERTTLNLIQISDLDFIHKLHSIPEVDEYNALGIPKDTAETESIITNWIKDNQVVEILNYTFIIQQKNNKEEIGLFGIKLGAKKYKRAEVWYKIHPDFWNKGFATEVLLSVLDYCFEELKLHRIQAGCAVENIGSIKVLEKVGMKREGRCRQVLPLKSGWSDNFEYAILESDIRKK
ncbi:GNAT family N-acetyltransferase [Flavobacterium ardleyense]|uniref:GNAT family N-acetyltransferase n=1 Tax=Flavobacterium ardleyense TaxID=2038737 RepID=A0ABW5Z8Q9_9FLAO